MVGDLSLPTGIFRTPIFTKLTKSGSYKEKSKEVANSQKEDTVSISITTDIYGITRTTTVKCSVKISIIDSNVTN